MLSKLKCHQKWNGTKIEILLVAIRAWKKDYHQTFDKLFFFYPVLPNGPSYPVPTII